MPRRFAEWALALTVALAVHGGVLAVMVGWASDEPRRERSAGEQSVVWGSPMTVAAEETVVSDDEAEETVAETVAEPVDATTTVEAEDAEAEPTEELREVETASEADEVAETEERAERQAAAEPAETRPAEEAAEATAALGDTADRPVADEAMEDAAEPVQAEAAAEPAQRSDAEPVEVARAAEPAEREALEPSQSDPLAVPRAKPQDLASEALKRRKDKERREAAARRRAEEARKARNQKRSAAVNATAGQAKGSGGRREADGGRADASNYAGRVLAHLQRHKRYPSSAARRRLSGVVTIRFSIDASGRLRGVSLRGSSGEQVLDEAALAMVRRADPFPKIPGGLGRNAMSFTVPVRFRPR